jgi:hypothetical protein
VAHFFFIASSATLKSSAVGGLLGAQLRVVVDRPRHLRAPPQAGGVDQRQRPAIELDARVDRVARRPRLRRHDHPFLAEQTVDERRLAHVRAADQGKPRRLGHLLAPARQTRYERVEQVPGPQALSGGHGDRVAEPEPVELRREPLLARVVHLVGGHDHGHAAPAQLTRELRVARPQPGTSVDHEHGKIGLLDRDQRLAADLLGHLVLTREVDAAGVDQREVQPVPVRVDLLAVARDAGLLVHDRGARAAQAVDERRLADVGVADYRHPRAPHRARSTSSTMRATT